MADESNFSEEQRKEIYERDNHRCVFCGLGEREGIATHIEYLAPPREDKPLTSNWGVVICENHRSDNILGYSSSGREFFLDLHQLGMELGDRKIIKFVREILLIYEEYEIDDEIIWKKPNE
jgi:hypothetical protein